MAQFQGQSLADARDRQLSHARGHWGVDQAASDIPPRGVAIPVTPHVYALEVARFWKDDVLVGMLAGMETWGTVFSAGRTCVTTAHDIAERLRASLVLPPAEEVDELGSSCSGAGPLLANMIRDIRSALLAIRDDSGSTRKALDGADAMTPPAARLFWNKISSAALGARSSRAAVSSQEKWQAIVSGAKEGAENVGRVIGEAAGFVGEAGGRALKGAAEGFGLVNLALLAGAGVVAWKVL